MQHATAHQDPAAVLAISGSLRRGSTNTSTLRTVQQVADGHARIDLYHELASLPHFDPDLDREDTTPPKAVTELRNQIAHHDAVMICTPEYAGATPGALKNLLEWTISSASLGQVPTAWINPSTAPAGAADAHSSLRTVLGYAGAYIVEDACSNLPVPRTAIDDGVIQDADLRAVLRKSLDTLIAATRP